MKLVASDVTVVVLNNTGHGILEENPRGDHPRAREVSLKMHVSGVHGSCLNLPPESEA
jgi:hypothetical protein